MCSTWRASFPAHGIWLPVESRNGLRRPEYAVWYWAAESIERNQLVQYGMDLCLPRLYGGACEILDSTSMPIQQDAVNRPAVVKFRNQPVKMPGCAADAMDHQHSLPGFGRFSDICFVLHRITSLTAWFSNEFYHKQLKNARQARLHGRVWNQTSIFCGYMVR
jgi:hypothetical protein